ncbi:hypothetical protein GHT06_009027 [Daphnia sinensis]|uniref:Endonuclease/exonuclease/phosphatase domain-containing protein n=1 Tax=Daphnia sinensis TaxID=1820382 RepID=A0AAD5Q2S2_9CRUS|nr:hypothetical protein GHT06_009027 [Daphnia sinensis]
MHPPAPGKNRFDGQPDMRIKENRIWAEKWNQKIPLSSGKGYWQSKQVTNRGTGNATEDKEKDKEEEKVKIKEEVAVVENKEEVIGEEKEDAKEEKEEVKEKEKEEMKEEVKEKEKEEMKEEEKKEMKEEVKEETDYAKATGANIQFGLVNARSLRDTKSNIRKIRKLKKLASKRDIIVVSETWFTNDPNETDVINACPDEFIPVHEPRTDDRKGGGVAVFYRESKFKLANFSTTHYGSFEHLDISLNFGTDTRQIRLIMIYRPPRNRKTRQTQFDKGDFLEHFKDLLNNAQEEKGKLLICGDFNLNIAKPDQYDKGFLKLMEDHGLVQSVKKPTHTGGNILDLIITKQSDSLVKNLTVGNYFSDHRFIHFEINI